DQTEAMTLADRIVVLRDGRVEQVGTPLELYHRPANRFVAGFIGSPPMNFLSADALDLATEGTVEIGVRPEDLREVGSGQFKGEITLVEELGEAHLIHLETPAGPIVAKLPGAATHARGSEIHLDAARERLHRFDAEGNAIFQASAS
ncbi:MAG: TOBE domain-containing protein, partial [Pseudomonadota bacterium]